MKPLIFAIFAITLITQSFAAVTPRIDINGKNKVSFKDATTTTSSGNVALPSWKWLRGKTYVQAQFAKLQPGQWHQVSFLFTPEKDGVVELNLLTNPRQKPAYFDLLEITGAELKNSSFEEVNEKNSLPLSWRKKDLKKEPAYPGMLIMDKFHTIKDGKHAILTSHDSRFIQKFAVTKEQPVTVKAWVFVPKK